MSELSPKVHRFVEEYLVDLNGKQAAIRAGYSPRTAESQGSRLLRNAKVQEAITAGRERLSRKTGITQERVLQELAKIGFSDIRRAVRWAGAATDAEEVIETELEPQAHGGALKRSRREGAGAVELVGSDEIDADTAAAIAEVSQTQSGIRIKLHDKRAALVDIGRHLGMFVDRTELSGPKGGPIHAVAELPDPAKRALEELSRRAEAIGNAPPMQGGSVLPAEVRDEQG